MEFDFRQLFDQFNSTESYTILTIMLIAFLLGLIVGFLLRSGTVRRLRRDLETARQALTAKETEVTELLARLQAATDDTTAREAEARRLRAELETAQAGFRQAEADKNRLYTDLHALNEEAEKLRVSNRSYLTTIEDLNDQITGLRARHEQLLSDVKTPPSVATAARTIGTDGDTLHRLTAIENKMLQLESENISLKQELDEIKNQAISPTQSASETIHSMEMREIVSSPVTSPTLPEDAAALAELPQDDLTLIKGIGPFIARRLHAIGVFTFEQISRWDEARIREVTQQLEYFEGRIAKDDWVGQARQLQLLKMQDPETLHRLVAAGRDPFNLQIIEGIGPKIEHLLKEAGIETWEHLALTSEERLREILHEAGTSFQMHDPTTWPMQARLAVNGNWSLLDDYQQQLKGGRE